MIAALPPRVRDTDPDPRGRLDSTLGVTTWTTPLAAGYVAPRRDVPVDPELGEPPAWWHGDEEASQTFLAAQGASLG